MATYYAAVDMGASSGRLILGHMENGKMELEEIHRFENGMVKKDGEEIKSKVMEVSGDEIKYKMWDFVVFCEFV